MVNMTSRCPACGKGTLRPGAIHEEMFGVDLGTYPGEICDRCGESFQSSENMGKIAERAKELGIWGLASKKSRLRDLATRLLCESPPRLLAISK